MWDIFHISKDMTLATWSLRERLEVAVVSKNLVSNFYCLHFQMLKTTLDLNTFEFNDIQESKGFIEGMKNIYLFFESFSSPW